MSDLERVLPVRSVQVNSGSDQFAGAGLVGFGNGGGQGNGSAATASPSGEGVVSETRG